ncbi:MAG: phospholipid carrier-dependent glycosyltransferase [Microcoleaceae cyanobacterium]
MIGIFLISLILRFWGLSRFNTLVFDEVYYAKFGNNYLTQTPFFNAHPPLAQYLIAIGIWIGSYFPFGQDTVNNLAGATLSTWSYRWFNALTGSFIPLIVGAIAYQLTHRRSYCFIATLLMAVEGLFLVESRYALSSIYLVFFGLVAHLCLILALNKQGKLRGIYLIFSGINFGATVAVKWNGLGFLLGIYIFLITIWIVPYLISSNSADLTLRSPLQRLRALTIIQLLLTLVILPIIIYLLTWIPHLQLNPTPGFWKLHDQMITFHRNLGDGTEIHPYCSKWYTWPLMMRPIAYFFEKVENTEQINLSLLPLENTQLPIIYAVNGMGNPLLWWLSTLALLLSIWFLLKRVGIWINIKWQSWQRISLSQNILNVRLLPVAEYWILFYLCTNALANFLPWAIVSRCTFIYHYISTLAFTILLLSWWIERWLYSSHNYLRVMGLSLIFGSIFTFIFWCPIYLGLPLTLEGWKLRMWLSSWV